MKELALIAGSVETLWLMGFRYAFLTRSFSSVDKLPQMPAR
jgi:hypothetical protein